MFALVHVAVTDGLGRELWLQSARGLAAVERLRHRCSFYGLHVMLAQGMFGARPKNRVRGLDGRPIECVSLLDHAGEPKSSRSSLWGRTFGPVCRPGSNTRMNETAHVR